MTAADVPPDYTYYPLALFTCGIFLFMFRYVSPTLSAYIFPGFTQLTEGKQIYWITRYASYIILNSYCFFSSLEYKVLKGRSVVRCQLLACVGSIRLGHIFSLFFTKLSQNLCLDKISNDLETGSYGSKNYVTWSNLGKSFVRSRGHILSRIIMKLG